MEIYFNISQVFVIGSGNGSINSTKPLPEPASCYLNPLEQTALKFIMKITQMFFQENVWMLDPT